MTLQTVLYNGTHKVQLVEYWPDSRQAVIRWPKCTDKHCEFPHEKGYHVTVVDAALIVEWVGT